MTELPPSATEQAASDADQGLIHRHEWEVVTALPRLQSMHDLLRWDVSKSRILSAGVCRICGEPDRRSVTECSDPDCRAHRICTRPYR